MRIIVGAAGGPRLQNKVVDVGPAPPPYPLHLLHRLDVIANKFAGIGRPGLQR